MFSAVRCPARASPRIHLRYHCPQYHNFVFCPAVSSRVHRVHCPAVSYACHSVSALFTLSAHLTHCALFIGKSEYKSKFACLFSSFFPLISSTGAGMSPLYYSDIFSSFPAELGMLPLYPNTHFLSCTHSLRPLLRRRYSVCSFPCPPPWTFHSQDPLVKG
jgi:hypothetical protein